MKKTIELDRFRIYGARIKQDYTYVPAFCSHLSGMTNQSHDTLAPCGRGQGEGLNPCKKKAAFTLAEVLITLGIIGVVAALTIPGLINNYKAHRLSAQFLKSYSTIQQVFKQMEADDVSLDPSTYPKSTFYKTFAKYLTNVTDCGRTGDSCFGVELRKYYQNMQKNLKAENFTTSVKSIGWHIDDGILQMNDGTIYMFENNEENNNVFVTVDLNGYNNKPNQWGYDVFTFQFLDGELKTMGDKDTLYTDMDLYCNINSKNDYNGIACAQKAKENPDEYFKWVIKNVK